MENFYIFVEKVFIPAILPIILLILTHYLQRKENDRINKNITNITSDISDVKDFTSKIEENEEKANKNSSENDTVVVPATYTIDFIKENKIYFCKKWRTFRDVSNIAFYFYKKVVAYAKFSKIDFLKLNLDIQRNFFKNFPLENYENLDFYKLEDFKEINYHWIDKWNSAVQWQQYTKLDIIKK